MIIKKEKNFCFPVLKNDLLLYEAVIKNEADTVRKVLKETVDVDSRNNVSRKISTNKIKNQRNSTTMEQKCLKRDDFIDHNWIAFNLVSVFDSKSNISKMENILRTIQNRIFPLCPPR